MTPLLRLSSDLDLSGHLLNLDHNELCRLERGEADEDVDDTEIAVILGGGFGIALDEVSIARATTLKCALAIERVKKRAHVQSNLSPQRLIIRFKDDPLRTAIQAFLEVQR